METTRMRPVRRKTQRSSIEAEARTSPRSAPVDNAPIRSTTESGRFLGAKPYRAPGADLRRDYRLTLELSAILALLVAITAVRAPMQAGSDAEEFALTNQEVVQMEDIQQTEQIERPPPPPRPPVPVEVPNDEILEDVALDLDVTLDLDAPVDLPPPPAPPPVEEVEEDEQEIFVVVEQMPEIVGGASKVYDYLEYPEIARQAGVEGLVVVQVLVEPSGLPSELTVARSASDVLDQAALSAVAKLTFVPGKQRGKAVRVRMAIPIRFRLRQATNGE